MRVSSGPALLGCRQEGLGKTSGGGRKRLHPDVLPGGGVEDGEAPNGLQPALCASPPGSVARPSFGAVRLAQVGMGILGMMLATAVTTPPEQPKLQSLRADFGNIATQEVGHLVDGRAAAKTLP